jgi:Ca2+-binding EF-hand superfamily protein
MRFIRLQRLFEGFKSVKYPQFLDIIFFDESLSFYNKAISILKQIGDAQTIIKTILKSTASSKISLNEFQAFLESKLGNKIPKNITTKFDVDQDGYININDLKAVLDRYTKTSFFKYENPDNLLDNVLHSKIKLKEDKFKQLVKDIKVAMKNKNITVIGLFNKLDSDSDGFISNSEFNKQIDSVITLAPSIKDQLFNSLDRRQLGIVDIETFLKVFKEYSTTEKVLNNYNSSMKIIGILNLKF